MPRRPNRIPRYALLLLAGIGLLLVGYFLLQRYFWLNLHAVVPGEIYRSAQPTEALLTRLQRDQHLQTVLKLNSDTDSAPSEREADVVRKLGLNYIHLKLSMSRLPTRHQLLQIIDILQTAPKPLLVHCNAGADRTGLVSVLAAMADGQSLQQARDAQLNACYLHVGLPGEDVVEVLDQFAVERALAKKSATTFADFVDYVRNDYYPTFYHARIEYLDGSSAGAELRVTNASRWFFARGSDDRYELSAYQTNSDGTRAILGRASVPPLDPHASVRRSIAYTTAPDPGRPIQFDILHVGETWFAQRGSPVASVGP